MKWTEPCLSGRRRGGHLERQTAPGSLQRSGPGAGTAGPHGSQRWLAGRTGPSCPAPSRLPPLPGRPCVVPLPDPLASPFIAADASPDILDASSVDVYTL